MDIDAQRDSVIMIILQSISMKTFSAVVLLSISLLSTHAQAGHKEDCDRPEYAQQYATGFNGELKGALDKFKEQDKHYRAKIDGMKAAFIKVDAWTDAEASVFMVKASMTDDDAKALEVERKKAASDFKVQLLSLVATKLRNCAPTACLGQLQSAKLMCYILRRSERGNYSNPRSQRRPK